MSKNVLRIVGTGPGAIEHMSMRAIEAVKESECIAGYKLYLELISDMTKGKDIHLSKMTQEIERCEWAVRKAAEGNKTCIVSGGDSGIYGMASPLMESAERLGADIDIEVIPGISAANAAASLLGAPLTHDFVCISLSDRLTDLDLILKRVRFAAEADFVIVLYNPKSKVRRNHLETALGIIQNHRKPQTPAGIVSNAYREGESVIVTNLSSVNEYEIGMNSTVIIGNSSSKIINGRFLTPRGYQN